MQKTIINLQPRGEIGTLESVKRLLYLALIVILVLMVVFVYRNRVGLGLASPPASGADQTPTSSPYAPGAHPATIVWQSVDRTPDGFKVQMPAEIKEIQVPAYNEQGGSEQVDMIYAYPDSETCYSVSWADDPPVERANFDVPDRTLDMARDDAMARSQTTLVEESTFSQQGFPGRYFSSRNLGGGVLNSRLILARKRLYMLTATFPTAGARRDEDVARFFSSFTVVPTSSH
ncbi:MAG: hypothetical protein WA802_01570 [Terracidiphilus sp.]